MNEGEGKLFCSSKSIIIQRGFEKRTSANTLKRLPSCAEGEVKRDEGNVTERQASQAEIFQRY